MMHSVRLAFARQLVLRPVMVESQDAALAPRRHSRFLLCWQNNPSRLFVVFSACFNPKKILHGRRPSSRAYQERERPRFPGPRLRARQHFTCIFQLGASYLPSLRAIGSENYKKQRLNDGGGPSMLALTGPLDVGNASPRCLNHARLLLGKGRPKVNPSLFNPVVPRFSSFSPSCRCGTARNFLPSIICHLSHQSSP